MKKIIFTNGCFDLLHVGHLKVLKEAAKLAKKYNAKLIVGINSDKSRVEWGSRLPIIPAVERKEMLEAIKGVDKVIIHKDASVYKLVKKLKPFIIVKGDDYKGKVVGQDLARVHLVKKTKKKQSTTKIIEKIRKLKIWE